MWRPQNHWFQYHKLGYLKWMVYKGNSIYKWMIWGGTFILRNPHIPRTSAFWTTDHFAFCAGRRKGTSSCWKDWCAAAAWTWIHGAVVSHAKSENFQSWACPSTSTQQLDFFENWQQNNLLKSEDPHHVHVRLEWPYISYNIYIYNHI